MNLVKRLQSIAGSPKGWARALLGLPDSYMSWDPALHEKALRTAERWVYGPRGLQAYEESCPGDLARLARRSVAHYAARESFYPWHVRALRRVLGLGFLLATQLAVVRSLVSSRTRAEQPSRIVTFKVVARLKPDVEAAFPDGSALWVDDPPRTWGWDDVGFALRACVQCPKLLLYPHLLANFVQMQGQIRTLLARHSPEAVLSSIERSPHASLLTAYLRRRNVRHLNIMHGEHFFGAHNAFCEFDSMLVWSEYFADLYRRSRCRPGEVRVVGCVPHRRMAARRRERCGAPLSVLLIHNWVMDSSPKIQQGALRFLEAVPEGASVLLRGHPAAGEECVASAAKFTEVLSSRGVGLRVEPQLGSSISMEDAVADRPVVVGTASSILLDAWVAGCKVVYLEGLACVESYLPRYGGSPNVMVFDASTSVDSVRRFLAAPAVDDDAEMERVNRLTDLGPYLPTRGGSSTDESAGRAGST